MYGFSNMLGTAEGSGINNACSQKTKEYSLHFAERK
jgi:hypothetical protein